MRQTVDQEEKIGEVGYGIQALRYSVAVDQGAKASNGGERYAIGIYVLSACMICPVLEHT